MQTFLPTVQDAEKQALHAYIRRIEEAGQHLNPSQRYLRWAPMKLNDTDQNPKNMFHAQIVFANNGIALPIHCAVKVKAVDPDNKPSAFYEPYFMQCLPHHPNLLRLMGVTYIQKDMRLLLEMELCRCTLAQFYDHCRFYLAPSQIRLIIKQILKGLAHIHHNDIIHCDIKMHNILIAAETPNDSGVYESFNFVSEENDRCNWVKICDFGSAQKLYRNGFGSGPYLAPEYEVNPEGCKAPETLLLLPYDDAVDIWAVGVILSELFDAKRHPFKSFNTHIDETGKTHYSVPSHQEQLDWASEITGPFSIDLIEASRECGVLSQAGVRPPPTSSQMLFPMDVVGFDYYFEHVQKKHGVDAMEFLRALLRPVNTERATAVTALMDPYFARPYYNAPTTPVTPVTPLSPDMPITPGSK